MRPFGISWSASYGAAVTAYWHFFERKILWGWPTRNLKSQDVFSSVIS
jgi:hypothetical protein